MDSLLIFSIFGQTKRVKFSIRKSYQIKSKFLVGNGGKLMCQVPTSRKGSVFNDPLEITQLLFNYTS